MKKEECILTKKINVVSLFDGISCGRLAFERAGIEVDSYYAFEIDKYAKAISRYDYPDIEQCGDVLEADFGKFSGIDFVIGGSPCTFWSIARNNREIDKSGMGWKLFMKFAEAVKIIKPKFFLYENVASMPNSIKEYITEELEAPPILINSALVSAQQRKRLYWTNIKDVVQPDDKEIFLRDILESGITPRDKSLCIDACYYKGGNHSSPNKQSGKRRMVYEPVKVDEKNQTINFCGNSVMESVGAALRTRKDEAGKFKRLEVRKDNKLNSLTTVLTDSMICQPIRVGKVGKGGQGERVYSVIGKTVSISANGGGRGANTGLYKVDLPDGDYVIRKLTVIEAERCQTLPDNYTCFGIDDKGKTIKISNTQRYKCIGNGWTVDIIAHILGFSQNKTVLQNIEPKGSFLL